jgi:hypothetical protein
MPDTPEHRARMHQLARQARRADRPPWDRVIRLPHFHDETMTFEQRRDATVEIIRQSGWRSDGRLEELLEELAGAIDAEDFDSAWDEIYDLADEDRVWIDTIA